jgi:hypothetical protein
MRHSGSEEDIVPTLRSFRVRLSGVSGGALVATLCALLAAPAAAVPFQDTQAAATAPAAAPAESVKLSNDQLDSLVAPVALYPDPLLAQCLVASTYPIDIVAAQQWLAKNSTLKGEALTKAAEQQPWDPSVQALVALPDALKLLSENIKWTADLGDAFLADQNAVMDAVQRLRAKAKDAGKLSSSEQQKVETKVVETKTVIEIQPASTQVVYVPTYSPTVIWGPPVYPYPPMYYPPYYAGGALIGFGVGVAVGIGMSGGWGWNCGWHGGGNTININNNNNYINHNNTRNNVNKSGNSNWQHNAQQRGGAPYKDKATASKYGGGARGDSPQARQSQASQRQAGSMDRGGASSRPSTSSFDRGGASSRSGSSSFDRGGSASSQVGSRNVSSSSRGGSAFGGSSHSGSQARASSSRGASSMGGMSRGGGGGRRR